ncbi:BlaI/MecI/CopY family transcriptional regulator [Geoglobus acetivorans]|uniref:Transcriptional regulator n=1 Tax=Geoglobus acetivorans TaxID=565033 RepID=A0A0A7GG77_GEOAI|nr:hypothetical protein GACE_2066 [Geoglobus acetivorans]
MVKKERIEFDENISPLSPLEERIMDFLWTNGPSPIGVISESLNVTMSSVAATLDRLVKNGIVERRQEKVDGRRKFVYYPLLSKDDMVKMFVENILDRLVENFGDVVVEYFHRRGIRQ